MNNLFFLVVPAHRIPVDRVPVHAVPIHRVPVDTVPGDRVVARPQQLAGLDARVAALRAGAVYSGEGIQVANLGWARRRAGKRPGRGQQTILDLIWGQIRLILQQQCHDARPRSAGIYSRAQHHQ